MPARKVDKQSHVQLKEARAKMIPIFKKQHVRKAGVFGSFARGEAKKKSDVDILVDVQRGTTLLDMVRMKNELEKALGRPVDLLTYKSLHPLLKKSVMSDHIVVYEKRS